jgi:MFS family permease
VRAVCANAAVRDTQLALACARAVDLAQLVVVSAFLFARGDAALVATYGVVRTLVPAAGVPAITALGCRLGHGALLRAMGIVAAIGSFAMATVVVSGGPTVGVLAAAAVVGVAVGCFRPVICALMPSLTRSPAELLASNAATGLLEGACTLVGPVVGTFIAVVLGVPTLLAVTGVGMLAAAFVAGRLPASPKTHQAEQRGHAERLADMRPAPANSPPTPPLASSRCWAPRGHSFGGLPA